MRGYLWILLALLGFSAMGIVLKLANAAGCRPTPINALLCIWSMVYAAAGLLVHPGGFGAPASIAMLAIPFGICASVAILAFQSGLRYGNVSTSWLAINLSSGLPALASIVVYHEPVGWLRGIALCLIPVSMALLWKDKLDAEKRDH